MGVADIFSHYNNDLRHNDDPRYNNVPVCRDYSERSAFIGSMREAFRAGMKQAAMATIRMVTAAIVKICGSRGVTWNRKLASMRPSAMAPASPMTAPIT